MPETRSESLPASALALGVRRTMRWHKRFVSLSCCFGLSLLLLHSLSFARAQQQARTDPSEAAALNAIFRRWGLHASPEWNISGELCSGVAGDKIDWDYYPDINPLIKRVHYLDVVGQVPGELQNLTYLIDLNLGYNYLTGSLPSFIGELKALEYLFVSFNALDGVLPRELGNLKNLLSLGISSNKFVGPLPEILENLTKLQQLHASDNDFTGRIPDYIGSLSNLIELRLQGNNFDGPIPASFSNLVKLDYLILRNCRISDSLASVDFSKFVQLRYLFLGNNSLSGSLPDTKSTSLHTIDLSYNMLFGELPSWLSEENLHVNLVWNNFMIESSNRSVLPSGLNCLQRNTPCFPASPDNSSFAVDSGGKRLIRGSDKSNYEPDDADLQGASYYVTDTKRWGVSNSGRYDVQSINESFTVYTSQQFANTLDSDLFQTARMSPSSLRYYGIGLKNGVYNVDLQFAEIFFPDNQTWKSVGRRIFNIYIQGELREKDFDIKKQTNGKSYTAVRRQYIVNVTENFMEIHLFWAGKGTCCIPKQGHYGPSISALSVVPYGNNNEVDQSTGSKNTRNSKTGLVVGVTVSTSIILGLLAIGTFVWRQKRKKLEVEMGELLSVVGRSNVFSYGEIKSATNNFSQSNILGRGGYGLVYKGKLHDGRMIAVKQLSPTSHQGKREFMTEIATISAVQHRNLVKLHGCCIESKAPLLVYEFLENGSLDQAIFATGKTNLNLDWRTRFDICIGIARGLAYLHEESSTRIVHRDIKTSNVLLDGDLNPKISDFGLARHYEDNMTHLSTGVAGTLGYLAPEYAMMGHLTEKADVFAYGVVAMEIIAGRPNFDESVEDDKKYLLGWAWWLHERRQTLEMLDPKLAKFDEKEVVRVINIILLCTVGLPEQRPPMSKVVSMLTEDTEMSEVDMSMWPSYVPQWHRKSRSDSFFASSMQQSSGTESSVPSSSGNNTKSHGETFPLVLSANSISEFAEGR
uniref:non-specific serine/threonine protein kinase n=1 Tax=Oryza barthii TaxID=65489 RepID=A0A0D3GXB4_9ORYZ